MKPTPVQGIRFTGNQGEFILENPQRNSSLYFPLGNEAGMMSSITPTLNGDSKTGQNSFLTEPVSSEDLHNSRSARNFWVYIHAKGNSGTVWSAAGNSASQTANNFVKDNAEKVTLTCGMLWHKIVRENKKLGLCSEIVNYVPASGDQAELMRVRITNTGKKNLKITPTAALPIYGRSAENVRDHRHVTSLLHRIATVKNGVEVKPAMSFDERGHKVNELVYAVYGAEGGGAAPAGFFPVVEDFIGEGGSYDWPEAVVTNSDDCLSSGKKREGYEAVGAIRFEDVILKPGRSVSFILVSAVFKGECGAKKYLNDKAFDKGLEQTRAYWKEKADTLVFSGGDPAFDNWMSWVTIQPILRRMFGCSFLPHHDYGRGGRGWRDLWQDCLALLVMEPSDVRNLLLNNYAGVRMDGSNATIIGSRPGEFIADRNNIARTWMDHGAWPFLTTMLYLNQSGDLGFLLEEQTYFKDRLSRRSRAPDAEWTPEYGNKQKDAAGAVHKASVIEHIILQNLVQFFNVGEHNNILLEGADWNDAMDMARDKGESVAFTSFYAWNLAEIAKLLSAIAARTGRNELEISEEILVLLDSQGQKTDYSSVAQKRAVLEKYFDASRHDVSGRKMKMNIRTLAKDLEEKSAWLYDHVRKNEWIVNRDGYGWFNGYYDNRGMRVEGDHANGVRMTLTGQVFSVMSGLATNDQVVKITESVKKYLKDKKIGGYRLNTDFQELKLDLGRGFGFAFGHKENGAVFCHMAVMYGNALYRRGFVKEGWDVLKSLFDLSSDFENSRIYPGIPEYFNEKRRGMYHYLTGSASWLLLTVLTEVYGVRGKLGDLELEPKLLAEQFDKNGEAGVTTLFAGRKLEVRYFNKGKFDFKSYRIAGVRLDGKGIPVRNDRNSALIKVEELQKLDSKKSHILEVELVKI